MKDFKKITKKESITILESKSNLLLASIWKNLDQTKDNIINNYEDINNDINNDKNANFRKCIRKQSNALQFNNFSWLYFNSFNESFLYNDWLILTSENNTMIYKIK